MTCERLPAPLAMLKERDDAGREQVAGMLGRRVLGSRVLGRRVLVRRVLVRLDVASPVLGRFAAANEDNT